MTTTKTTKLFNLTDVETPELKARSLTNNSFFINGELLQPGKSMLVNKPLHELHYDGLEHLVTVGAVFLGDEPPAKYKAAQDALPAAMRPSVPTTPAAEPTPAQTKPTVPPAKGSSKFPAAEAVVADVQAHPETKKDG